MRLKLDRTSLLSEVTIAPITAPKFCSSIWVRLLACLPVYPLVIDPCYVVTLQYEQRPVLGKAPSGRGYHATILADSRIFLFGGSNGSSTYDDVYILDLAAGAYLPQVTSFNVEL